MKWKTAVASQIAVLHQSYNYKRLSHKLKTDDNIAHIEENATTHTYTHKLPTHNPQTFSRNEISYA